MTHSARPGVRHAYLCAKCHRRLFFTQAQKKPPVCDRDESHGPMERQKNQPYLGQRTEFLTNPAKRTATKT